MSKKSNTPSDDDILKILDQLDGTTPPVIDLPELGVAGPIEEETISPEEIAANDERPIVINLPERQDPTKVMLGTVGVADVAAVPMVDPVILGPVVENKPAFDNNGEPVAPNPAHSVTAHVPVTMTVQQAQTNQVIHEVTPIADAGAVNQPTAEEQEVCTMFGVNVWWEERGEYWSIRQGPRVGGVPAGASLDEWKSRCASISVTQTRAQGPSS